MSDVRQGQKKGVLQNQQQRGRFALGWLRRGQVDNCEAGSKQMIEFIPLVKQNVPLRTTIGSPCPISTEGMARFFQSSLVWHGDGLAGRCGRQTEHHLANQDHRALWDGDMAGRSSADIREERSSSSATSFSGVTEARLSLPATFNRADQFAALATPREAPAVNCAPKEPIKDWLQ